MESDDFTRHYIIRYLSARELVLPPLILNSANYSQWAIIQANESPVGVATQTVYGVMNSILREYNCGM